MNVRILVQMKTLDCVSIGFLLHDLLSNSPVRSPRFSTGYEGKENMFYFLKEQHYFTTYCKINFLYKFQNYMHGTHTQTHTTQGHTSQRHTSYKAQRHDTTQKGHTPASKGYTPHKKSISLNISSIKRI